jgi:hypothetical protein
MRNPGLLMIGNYLSQPKHNRNIWNDLAERLAMNGWEVINQIALTKKHSG